MPRSRVVINRGAKYAPATALNGFCKLLSKECDAAIENSWPNQLRDGNQGRIERQLQYFRSQINSVNERFSQIQTYANENPRFGTPHKKTILEENRSRIIRKLSRTIEILEEAIGELEHRGQLPEPLQCQEDFDPSDVNTGIPIDDMIEDEFVIKEEPRLSSPPPLQPGPIPDFDPSLFYEEYSNENENEEGNNLPIEEPAEQTVGIPFSPISELSIRQQIAEHHREIGRHHAAIGHLYGMLGGESSQ